MSPEASTPPPGKPPVLRAPRTGRALGVLALAVALGAAGGFAWWVLRVDQPAQQRLDELLAGNDRSFTSLVAEIHAQQESLNELSAQEKVASGRVAELEREVSRLAAEDATRGAPEAAVLRVARISHLVQAADLALRVEGDHALAASALRAAREQLEVLRPAEEALHAAIGTALTALDGITEPPLAAANAEWAAVSLALDKLPVKLAAGSSTTTPAGAAPAPVEGWRGVLHAMWRDLLGLVEIRRLTPADEAFVDPARHALNLAALRQEIALLRGSLLRRDAVAVKVSAEVIGQALSRDFAPEAPEVQALQTKLAALRDMDLVPALPDLAECLALLPALSAELAAAPATTATPVAPATPTTPTPPADPAGFVPPPADPRDIM